MTAIVKRLTRLVRYVRALSYRIWHRGITFTGPVFLGRGSSLRTEDGGTIKLGAYAYLDERVLLHSVGGSMTLGHGVFCNRDTVIVAMERIEIGAQVTIAERVTIRDHDHQIADLNRPVMEQGYVTAPIRIDEGSWVGCNAVILKGVHIGRHAVVAAAAVVTRDVPDYAVVAGVPARVIRQREALG